MIVPADVVPVTSVLLNTAAGGLCLVWVWPALSEHRNTRVWGGGRGGGEEYPGHSSGHLVIPWITVAELSLVTSISQSVFTVGWESRYGETIVITNTGRPAAVDIRVELCLVEEHRDPCHTQARHRLKYVLLWRWGDRILTLSKSLTWHEKHEEDWKSSSLPT